MSVANVGSDAPCSALLCYSHPRIPNRPLPPRTRHPRSHIHRSPIQSYYTAPILVFCPGPALATYATSHPLSQDSQAKTPRSTDSPTLASHSNWHSSPARLWLANPPSPVIAGLDGVVRSARSWKETSIVPALGFGSASAVGVVGEVAIAIYSASRIGYRQRPKRRRRVCASWRVCGPARRGTR